MVFGVLVISASYSMREMLARYLSSDNFSVYTADSAAMAAPMLENLKVHAVISEMNLQQASGLDLLLWLNHKHPHIHPVFLCDLDDSDLMQILREQRAAVFQRSNLNLMLLRELLLNMRTHARGVTYAFEQINLSEMVHMASHAGRPRHVYVTSPQSGQEGLMCFSQNRVQHAIYGESAGEDAFFEIMQMKRGMFEETPIVQGNYYTIASNLDKLLTLSAMRSDQKETERREEAASEVATTCCTVLSKDMSLADYFLQAYGDADLDLVYTDESKEAISQIKTKTDLLIVDLDLPGLDLFSLLDQMKQQAVAVDIILMGSQLEPDISRSLSYPQVTRFFMKPQQYKEIGELVSYNYLSQQFRGKLLDLSLFNVIQTFAYFRQSRLLEVTDFFSGKTGQLFIANGIVQHARFGERVGRDALKEMLGICYGVFRQETYWEPLQHSLKIDLPRLMLYLTRFLETRTNQEPLPREMLLQNGSMITLQAERMSYLLAMSHTQKAAPQGKRRRF